MRRAIALAAAILVLLTAFTPQPVTPQAKASPPPSRQVTFDYDTARDRFLTPPVRDTRPAVLQLPVVRGDTYGRWATTHCGTFQAWRSIQAANGWPETRIPVGKTAVIDCHATPAKATTPPKTPTAPAATGAAWVHPLASGKRAGHAGLCWGAARSGHTHKGVDLTAPTGTPIRAVAAGTIHTRAYSGGAGHYVTIAHAGNVFSRYMHLRAASPLGKGTRVQAGQTIGHVGATGNAKGPHLHFETLVGGASSRNAVNPATFMRRRSVHIGC